MVDYSSSLLKNPVFQEAPGMLGAGWDAPEEGRKQPFQDKSLSQAWREPIVSKVALWY